MKKFSLYHNQQMFIVKEDENNNIAVEKITEENIFEVENTLCLYQDDTNQNSIVIQTDTDANVAKKMMQDRMNDAIVEMKIYQRESNDTISFAVNRIKLQGFFEKYKVNAIYPLQYILKTLDPEGLVGILSEPFSFIKEFKEGVPINTDSSFGYDSIYGSMKEQIMYSQPKEMYESIVDSIIGATNIKSATFLSAGGKLSLNFNYKEISVGDILKILEEDKNLCIVDKISTRYRKKVLHKRLVAVSIFFSVLAGIGFLYWGQFKTRLLFAGNEANELSSTIERIDRAISDEKVKLPNIKIDDKFNILSVRDILSHYSNFYPIKLVCNFKDKNTIILDFNVKDAHFAENLLKDLSKRKIKTFKYKKVNHYEFNFNITEKITSVKDR